MVMTQPDRKLTYEEAAAEYGVAAQTIRNWVARGLIHKYTKALDRRAFVSTAEIDRLRNAEPQREERGE